MAGAKFTLRLKSYGAAFRVLRLGRRRKRGKRVHRGRKISVSDTTKEECGGCIDQR